MRFARALIAIPVAVAALVAPAAAEGLSLEEVGSFDSPTYVTSDPADPDRLFVVERPGRIQLSESGSISTFLDISSLVLNQGEDGVTNNEGGLFSMAFSPEYATDHHLYVVYRAADDPSTTGTDEAGDWQLDQYTAAGDTADPASRQKVLTVHYPGTDLNQQLHYGGQLEFGPDGHLYASLGDGGPQGDTDGNSQNTGNLFGSILRIDPTGSGGYTVPSSNPFTGNGCTDGCDEIWSYGLRNPWRFSFDRETAALAIADVGQDSWEEVDYEPLSLGLGWGDNFGWNCREGANPYLGPGGPAPICADRVGTFTEPVFEFPHPLNGCSAITGGYVVRDVSLGDLYGRYLYTDLCNGDLRSLQLAVPAASGDRSEGLSVPVVTSFGEDADCRIYVASLNGPVYRLTQSGATVPAACPEEPAPLPPPVQPPPQPPPGAIPSPGSGPVTLTLNLKANWQQLKEKLKFSATASEDSTLVAKARAIVKTAVELHANRKTTVEVALKPAKRRRLEATLGKKGLATVGVGATATDGSGLTATRRVLLRLRDCSIRPCSGLADAVALSRGSR